MDTLRRSRLQKREVVRFANRIPRISFLLRNANQTTRCGPVHQGAGAGFFNSAAGGMRATPSAEPGAGRNDYDRRWRNSSIGRTKGRSRSQAAERTRERRIIQRSSASSCARSVSSLTNPPAGVRRTCRFLPQSTRKVRSMKVPPGLRPDPSFASFAAHCVLCGAAQKTRPPRNASVQPERRKFPASHPERLTACGLCGTG